jgi:hypothetical protein
LAAGVAAPAVISARGSCRPVATQHAQRGAGRRVLEGRELVLGPISIKLLGMELAAVEEAHALDAGRLRAHDAERPHDLAGADLDRSERVGAVGGLDDSLEAQILSETERPGLRAGRDARGQQRRHEKADRETSESHGGSQTKRMRS